MQGQWTVPQHPHHQYKTLNSVECRAQRNRKNKGEAEGGGTVAAQSKPAEAEDQISKSEFSGTLDVKKYLTLAVRDQPHCKERRNIEVS